MEQIVRLCRTSDSFVVPHALPCAGLRALEDSFGRLPSTLVCLSLQVARHLGVDVQSGLSLLEVSVRQGLVPPNELEQEPEVCVLYYRRRRQGGKGEESFNNTVVGRKQATNVLSDDDLEIYLFAFGRVLVLTRVPRCSRCPTTYQSTVVGGSVQTLTSIHAVAPRRRCRACADVCVPRPPTVGRERVHGLAELCVAFE